VGKYRPESIQEATTSVRAGEIEGYDFLSPPPEPSKPLDQPTAASKVRLGRPQISKAEDPAQTKLTVYVDTDIKIAVEHLGSDLRKPDKRIVNGALKYVIDQYRAGKLDRSIFD
jgi:hypothetical protein